MTHSPLTRRAFTKLALAVFPATHLIVAQRLHAADAVTPPVGKPNSRIAGVQLGINVPYSFGAGVTNADDILNRCIQLGLSAVELRTQPVEAFLGVPADLIGAKSNVAVAGAAQSNAEQLRTWRRSVSMNRVREFRQKYEAAGVSIEVVKVDRIFAMAADELDYVFTFAKTLGARAISTEISKRDEDHKRLGEFADKHALMVGYHGHASTTPEHWEKAFSFARYNGANVDIGHFVAGNNGSPIEFIKRHHARITHVHLKDRRVNNGANVPFGEGDTPIADVLRLIRDQRWNIQATIEFEYPVPAGSDRMTEIARAIKYCRSVLA